MAGHVESNNSHKQINSLHPSDNYFYTFLSLFFK